MFEGSSVRLQVSVCDDSQSEKGLSTIQCGIVTYQNPIIKRPLEIIFRNKINFHGSRWSIVFVHAVYFSVRILMGTHTFPSLCNVTKTCNWYIPGSQLSVHTTSFRYQVHSFVVDLSVGKKYALKRHFQHFC